LDKSPNLK